MSGRREIIADVEVRKLRIWHDAGETDGMPWNVDGIDGQGGYTESCARFETYAEAVGVLPEFAASIGRSFR